MNNKKTLIILICVLLALAFLLVGALLLAKNAKSAVNTPSSEAAPMITLINKGTDSIEKVLFQTSSQQYTMSRSDGELQIEGYGELEQSDVAIEAIASAIVFIQADELIAENAADLEKFGFDGSRYFEITFSDGSTFRLEAGGEAPLGGAYVRINNENNVYLIENGVSGLFPEKEYFIEKDLLRDPTYTDESADKVVVINPENIVLSGGIRDKAIVIKENSEPSVDDMAYNSTHVLESYNNAACDNGVMSDIISSLLPFSADSALFANPTEDELSRFGLVTPRSTAEFDVQGEKHIIRLGNKNNESYYCTVDDVPCIFSVSATLVPWAELNEYDLLASPIYEPELTAVSSITFEADGNSNTYELTTNEMGEEQAISSAVLNGGAVDMDGFNNIYNAWLDMACPVKQSSDSPEDKPTLTVTFDFAQSDKTDVIQVYEIDSTTCLMRINDSIELYVSREKAKTVISLMK